MLAYRSASTRGRNLVQVRSSLFVLFLAAAVACGVASAQAGVATTTVMSGSPNPAATGSVVAITATVSSGSAGNGNVFGHPENGGQSDHYGCRHGEFVHHWHQQPDQRGAILYADHRIQHFR